MEEVAAVAAEDVVAAAAPEAVRAGCLAGKPGAAASAVERAVAEGVVAAGRRPRSAGQQQRKLN